MFLSKVMALERPNDELNNSNNYLPVGVVSFYPDSRANARCQDGHYVVVTQLGNYEDFLKKPEKPITTTTTTTTTAAAPTSP